jgi:hypothetical protein
MSRDWFIDAFGHPIADIRAKLLDEGWFGRSTAEPAARGDPPFTLDVQPDKSVLDILYERNPSLFRDPEQPAHERDPSIER